MQEELINPDENFDLIVIGAGLGGSIMGPYLKGDPQPGYGIPLRRQAYVNVHDKDDILRLGTTPWGTCSGIGGQQLHWGGLTIIPSEEDHDVATLGHGLNFSEEPRRAGSEQFARRFQFLAAA
jgi:hypothetical protein